MADERAQRRLAAILAADVAGYSRLMGDDEEGTLADLTAHRADLIDPCITEHGGRLFKTTGDGLLAEFASVVEAVRCAVAVQHGMSRRNAKLPEDRRIAFRIGVNLGDVIVQQDDVFGDGVNVAARLEGLAEPGGVVVSGSVYEQVNTKLDVHFDDLGLRQVKNIGQPVRAFSIQPSDAAVRNTPELPDQTLAEPGKPSIAVLPFDNLSDDRDQEYFSDGITEDIITELSKISGLFVIARHSTFAYKAKPVTLRQIGRELGVRYVLEGSVRRAGDRLRITAQLIDSATDLHLWADRYDHDVEDVFAVQAEVARSVAGALAVALKPSEGKRLDRPPTDDIEAYDLFLRTRATPWPPTRENVLSARSAYAHLAETAPDFVGGHAGLALTHAMAVVFGASPDPETDARIAVATARKAIALDEGFAPAHSALGLGYLAARRHDEAVASARRATELQPGDADAHMFLGIALLFAGEGEKACEEAEQALRIDPQYTNGPYLNLLGIAKFNAGRYAEAIETFKRNVARGGPVGPPMLHPWVAAYVAEGRMDEARETADQLLRFFPQFSIKGFRMIHMYKKAEDTERLIGFLRQAGLPE